MRRIVILLLLVIFLIGMIGLQQAVSNWRYVLSAEPGVLLYAAAFDSFEDEWKLSQGRLEATIVEEVLRLDVDDFQSALFSPAKPHFGDFDLRVEVRAVDGPLDNGFGVVFRLQDPENHYQFLISSDGFYKVSRRVNGDEKDLSTWIPSSAIREGLDATNWLRIVAYQDRYRFYINGEQVQLCIPDDPEAESTYVSIREECREGQMKDTLIDASLFSGQIGPVALTFDEPGVVTEFDNFIVFSPQPIGEGGT